MASRAWGRWSVAAAVVETAAALAALLLVGADARGQDYKIKPRDSQLPDGRTTFPGFRGPCFHVATEERDPLRPDQRHMHMFYGSLVRSESPTAEELLAVGTNCRRPADHSMYWMPTVSVGGKELTPNFMGIYWQSLNGLDPRKTRRIPDNFRYIASDANGDVDWACTVNQNAGNVTENLPDCGPNSNGIGLRITFPECWDGEPAGADGIHRVIPAIERQDGSRSCPPDFVQIPTQTLWPDFRGNFPGGNGAVLVSSGHGETSPASAMHADSITAFAGDAMEDLVANCINPYTGREARPGRCDGNVFFDGP